MEFQFILASPQCPDFMNKQGESIVNNGNMMKNNLLLLIVLHMVL